MGHSSLAEALLGGTLAHATSHAAKATTRAAVNTSPEPFSNLALSLSGDAAVPSMLWFAWSHPWAFFAVLAIVVAVMIALTARLVPVRGRDSRATSTAHDGGTGAHGPARSVRCASSTATRGRGGASAKAWANLPEQNYTPCATASRVNEEN